MAQLLWGWLEFPVAFLTDTVRKVQGCNNSSWGRTGQSNPREAEQIWRVMGGVPPLFALRLSSRIFRWKASESSLVPGMVNAGRKAYHIQLQIYSSHQSQPQILFKCPAGNLSLSSSFAWDRFEARWWKWMFWNWEVQSWKPRLPLNWRVGI